MRYMRLLTVLFLSLIFFKGYGQLKNAERAYDGMRYTEAIGYYQESMKRDSLSAASIAKLADSYDKTQQYTKALYWYDKLLTTRVADTAYRYRYGQLLAMDGQYKAAATQFKWVNSVKPDPQLESTVGLYEGGLNALLADSVNWQTALLNINSGYADFCPVTYGAGLVFVSDRPRNKVFQIGRAHV